jgi:hypothetical protein
MPCAGRGVTRWLASRPPLPLRFDSYSRFRLRREHERARKRNTTTAIPRRVTSSPQQSCIHCTVQMHVAVVNHYPGGNPSTVGPRRGCDPPKGLTCKDFPYGSNGEGSASNIRPK